jgi:protein TonB
MASPRTESETTIRLEPTLHDEPEKTVERRDAETPAVAAVQFDSAQQDQRQPPPAEAKRADAVERSEPPDVPQRKPTKRTVEARLPPRETTTRVESIASAPSAASQGVQTSTPPVEIVSVKPVYPPAALSAGLEGVVMLYVRVNERGEVVEADVFRSSGHAMLDEAALEAIYRWRFTAPDGKSGVAAEFIKPMPFRIVR